MDANLKEHGVPDQLNVYVLDSESSVTSHGRHSRLVVMCEPNDHRELYVREDLSDLPRASLADVMHVAMHPNHRLHPKGTRLVHVSSTEPYGARVGQSVDHYLRAV